MLLPVSPVFTSRAQRLGMWGCLLAAVGSAAQCAEQHNCQLFRIRPDGSGLQQLTHRLDFTPGVQVIRPRARGSNGTTAIGSVRLRYVL